MEAIIGTLLFIALAIFLISRKTKRKTYVGGKDREDNSSGNNSELGLKK